MSKPDYRISTPENVDLHLELAGTGNRALACLIDTALTWALVLLVLIAGFILTTCLSMVLPRPQGKDMVVIEFCIFGIMLFVLMIISFGYYIFFEGLWHGLTPGKKVAGIRVIDQSGQPVGWSGAIIRNLIRTVDMGFMLVGLLSMLIDSNERRLGDLAAGTMVIKERHPSEAAGHLKITASLPEQSSIDIGAVTPEQYEILVSFLGRRKLMNRAERPLLARRLAQYFRTALSEPDSNEAPETFLEKVYLCYQSRAEH